MVRVAGAVESRLNRAEQVQAEALEQAGRARSARSPSGSPTACCSPSGARPRPSTTSASRFPGHRAAGAAPRARRLRHGRPPAAKRGAHRRLLEEARERLDQRIAAPRNAAEVDPPLKSTAAFGPELFSRAEAADFSEDEPAPSVRFPAIAEAAEAADGRGRESTSPASRRSPSSRTTTSSASTSPRRRPSRSTARPAPSRSPPAR